MIDQESLLKKIDTCYNKRILVIGDIMLDEYHWCKVNRISPEAPVPVCRVEKTTLVPGGAANVAHNINTLDSTATLFGVVGKDSSGDKLLSVLKSYGLPTESIIQSTDKPTILKSRIVANQQHIVRVDREHIQELTLVNQEKLYLDIEKQIESADCLLISDYLKGTLSPTFTQEIIKLARKYNKAVVVDPKGDDFTKYKGATLLTPNFSEFQTVIKKSVSTEDDIKSESLKLISDLEIDALLVTRSEKGMSLVSDNKKLDIPALAKEVYDITGAGDTVISVLTIALASGFNFEHAAVLANYAASIVVGKVGTATTSFDELKSVLESGL